MRVRVRVLILVLVGKVSRRWNVQIQVIREQLNSTLEESVWKIKIHYSTAFFCRRDGCRDCFCSCTPYAGRSILI